MTTNHLEIPLIRQIYQELELDDNRVLNIYQYGSRSYGVNRPDSDYDFIIVTDHPDPPLIFKENSIDHKFTLYKDKDKKLYDIVCYSLENFKEILRRNLIIAIECIFLPNEFIYKNTIDLKDYYLNQAYNPELLRNCLHSYFRAEYWMCKKIWEQGDQARAKKSLYHSCRYLVFGLDILKNKSVTDYQAGNSYFNQIKGIDESLSFKEIDQVYKPITKELQKKFDDLYYQMTLIVKGIFEYHITIELPEPRNESLEHFREYCSTHKLKPVVINLSQGENPVQVMTSSYHSRQTYPDNITQIQTMATELKAAGFKPLRIKIESMASNQGVPETPEEHNFWPDKCYFEFHYKVPVLDQDSYNNLFKLCEKKGAHVSSNAFKKPTENDPMTYYYVTLRGFKCGRVEAFAQAKKLRDTLRSSGYKDKKLEREFVVYDTNLNLDNGW